METPDPTTTSYEIRYPRPPGTPDRAARLSPCREWLAVGPSTLREGVALSLCMLREHNAVEAWIALWRASVDPHDPKHVVQRKRVPLWLGGVVTGPREFQPSAPGAEPLALAPGMLCIVYGDSVAIDHPDMCQTAVLNAGDSWGPVLFVPLTLGGCHAPSTWSWGQVVVRGGRRWVHAYADPSTPPAYTDAPDGGFLLPHGLRFESASVRAGRVRRFK